MPIHTWSIPYLLNYLHHVSTMRIQPPCGLNLGNDLISLMDLWFMRFWSIFTLFNKETIWCAPYYTKLTKLWSSYDKGKTTKNPPYEFGCSIKFLMGQNDSF